MPRREEIKDQIHKVIDDNEGTLFETKDYLVKPLKSSDENHQILLREMYIDEYVNFMVVPLTQKTKEGAQKKLAGFDQQYQLYGLSCWAVENKSTGELLGIYGITYMAEESKNDKIEFNIALHPNTIGKGIGTRIVEQLRNPCFTLIFDQLGFEEIYSETLTYNTASQILAKKMGMVPTTEVEDGAGSYWATQGENRKDTSLTKYKITREQWEEIRDKPQFRTTECHPLERTIEQAIKDSNLSQEIRSHLEKIKEMQKTPSTSTKASAYKALKPQQKQPIH